MGGRDAQFFISGEARTIPQGNPVRGSIVIDDLRMGGGEIRRFLIEIIHRVAACAHQLVNQPIGVRDRTPRIDREA